MQRRTAVTAVTRARCTASSRVAICSGLRPSRASILTSGMRVSSPGVGVRGPSGRREWAAMARSDSRDLWYLDRRG
jgi:hypothetical protein